MQPQTGSEKQKSKSPKLAPKAKIRLKTQNLHQKLRKVCCVCCEVKAQYRLLKTGGIQKQRTVRLGLKNGSKNTKSIPPPSTVGASSRDCKGFPAPHGSNELGLSLELPKPRSPNTMIGSDCCCQNRKSILGRRIKLRGCWGFGY